MNVETIEKLHALVKHITETGEWILDPTDLKVINNTLLLVTKPLLTLKKRRSKHIVSDLMSMLVLYLNSFWLNFKKNMHR